MIMSFGRYKDKDLEDIPTGYLKWCLAEVGNLDGELQEEMENQIALREGKGVSRKIKTD